MLVISIWCGLSKCELTGNAIKHQVA